MMIERHVYDLTQPVPRGTYPAGEVEYLLCVLCERQDSSIAVYRRLITLNPRLGRGYCAFRIHKELPPLISEATFFQDSGRPCETYIVARNCVGDGKRVFEKLEQQVGVWQKISFRELAGRFVFEHCDSLYQDLYYIEAVPKS